MTSSSNNSWTVLTPEETAAAETLRPLTEGTERQDEPSALTEAGDGALGLSGENHLTSEETITKPCEETDRGDAVPLDVLHDSVQDVQTVDTGLSSIEQESFSDSYSHLSTNSEDCSGPPLTTETLGHLESGQEEEKREEEGQADVQDETQHQSLREEVPEEETEAAQWSPSETPQEMWRDTFDSSGKPSVLTESTNEPEPELRKRRSLLEKIGRREEEEEAEAEEDFQLPQRDEDSGITLNKCILGAVILLGFGTIFISGVFMDLDEESDYVNGELKDSEAPKKQEWLNPDVAHPDATELLNKLNNENGQMAMLQTQQQSQTEEPQVVEAQAAGGSTEQLQQQQQEEEVQKENSRFKRDMESVPELQKELEKMRTELAFVSVLKKEVETLRSTLTQLKLSAAAATSPPGGRTEDNNQRSAAQQSHRKDKHDRGVREEWKEKSEWKKENKQRKDGGKMEGKDKEWKKDRSEGDKKRKDDTREWRSRRGDEGKPWKEKNEKKEWSDRSDKKSKHDKFKEDKEGRSREERREGKHHGEKHKGPGEKERKKERGGYKEEHKDKYERKPWKERGEYESKNKRDEKEWNKNEKDQKKRNKNEKDQKKWNKNEKDQKKWNKNEEQRRWSQDEEEEWNGGETKHQKEWSEGKFEKHKGSEHREHTWSGKKPSRPKPSVGQPEYWSHQRERLQHSSKPLQPCDSADTCAKAEGVRPVVYAEFEAILQNYLSKAQTAGVNASQIDELKKLAAELFQNGVFPHDQMSFQDYVEDVGDILEDLVEGEEEDDDDGQSDYEDEMEDFEREVMQKFTLSGSGERGRVKGELREEGGREHA